MVRYFLLFFLVASITACTDKRGLNIQDDNFRESTFKIQDLESFVLKVTTGNGSTNKYSVNSLQAVYEQPHYNIVKHNAPNKFLFLVENLELEGKPNTEYTITFSLTRERLLAYQHVGDLKTHSVFSKAASEKNGSNYRIPWFEYSVNGYGQLVAEKNDRGENTNYARLKSAPWESSEYVSLGTKFNQRKYLKNYYVEDNERLFLPEGFENLITTPKELLEKYKINLGAGADIGSSANELSQSSPIVLRLNGSQLEIFKITSLEDENLDQETSESIAKQQETDQVKFCEASSNRFIEKAKTCILVKTSIVNVSYQQIARLPSQLDGSLSTALDISAGDPLTKYAVIKIGEFPEIQKVEQQVCTVLNCIPLVDYLDKEFDMRRMLYDTPNSFSGFFPGLTGPLQIVKFYFLEDHIEVRREDSTMVHDSSLASDNEVVLRLPAKYYRKSFINKEGKPIETPRYIPIQVSKDHLKNIDDIVATVDWASNSVVNVGSRISAYFGSGQCFIRTSSPIVENIKNEPKNGLLSFSHIADYSINPAYGSSCTKSWPGFSAWSNLYGSDSNYKLKERVAFKLHKKANDEFEALDLPDSVQKLLQFGAFTQPSLAPQPHGTVGHIDSVKNPAIIHNFKEGKQVKFIYSGLPEEEPFRSKVIAATQEVFDDWNDVLRRAFKGTPLETEKDLMLLEIEGEKPEHKTISYGDLEVNHLFYEKRAMDHGIWGVWVGTPNPRSGFYEAGNVTLFAGNVLRTLELQKWISPIKHDYNQRIANGYLEVEAAIAENEAEALRQQEAQQAEEQAAEQTATQDIAMNQNSNNTSNNNSNISGDANFVSLNKNSLDETRSSIRNSFLLSPQPIIDYYDIKTTDSFLKSNQNIFENGKLVGLPQYKKTYLDQSSFLEKAMNSSMGLSTYNLKHLKYTNRIKMAVEKNKGISPYEIQLEALTGFYDEFKDMPDVLDEKSKNGLQREIVRLGARQFAKNELKNMGLPSCFFEGPGAEDEMLTDIPLEDIFVKLFKTLVAHEMGHALGLRHNFNASMDKKNWEFEGENTGRRASSVMDYLNLQDRYNYQGPGPYDAYALRAIYTGLLPVDKLSLKNSQLKLVSNKFISIEDFKDQLAPDTAWLDISEQQLEASSVKLEKMAYCTDEYVGSTPECRRFDRGGDPLTAMRDYIQRYKSSYEWNSFPNDRYEFSYGHSYMKMAWSYHYFYNIRLYMDEAIYRISSGIGSEIWSQARENWTEEGHLTNAYYIAAQEGLNFLLSVVSSPDTVSGDDRYTRIDFDSYSFREADGTIVQKPVAMERQWVTGFFNNLEGRFRYLGSELDKQAAIHVMTHRIQNRESASLGDVDSRYSYLDFETSTQRIPLQDTRVAKMLYQNITDSLQAMALDRENVLVPLAPGYNAPVTSFMSYTAAIAGIWNLYSATVNEEKENFGNHFRIESRIGGPVQRDIANSDGEEIQNKILTVTDINAAKDDPLARHFFASSNDENNHFGNKLIRRAYYTRELAENTEIYDLFYRFIKKTYELHKTAIDSDDEYVQLNEEINTLLSTYPQEVTGWVTTGEMVKSIYYWIFNMQFNIDEGAHHLYTIVNNTYRELPITGLISKVIVDISIELRAEEQPLLNEGLLIQFTNYFVLRNQYNFIRSNLNLLNALYFYIESSARNN